jgi:hypothetical protein
VAIVFTTTNAQATEAKFCDMRAALLGSVAQERDKGVSKTKVMQILGSKLKGMAGYVNIVYNEMKNEPPKVVEAITRLSCSRE